MASINSYEYSPPRRHGRWLMDSNPADYAGDVDDHRNFPDPMAYDF